MLSSIYKAVNIPSAHVEMDGGKAYIYVVKTKGFRNKARAAQQRLTKLDIPFEFIQVRAEDSPAA